MKLDIHKSNSYKIILGLFVITGFIIFYFLFPSVNRSTFIFYTCIVILSLVFALLSDIVSKQNYSKIFFIIGIFIMSMIFAFSLDIGIDNPTYQAIFNSAANKTFCEYLFSLDIEKGYLSLNYIIYYLTNGNYYIFHVLIIFFSFFCWGKALYSYKNICSVSCMFLVLWSYFYFNIYASHLIRIFIAIPIVLYSFQFVICKNYKKFILFILLASMFHLSALIMLLLILLMLNKESFVKRRFFYIGIFTLIIPMILIFIAKYIAPYLGDRYSLYTSIKTLNISISNFDLLPIILLSIYCYRYIGKEHKDIYSMGIFLLYLSVIFSIFSSIVSLGRVTFFLNLGLFLVIPMIFKIKEKTREIFWIQMILVGYLLFVMLYIRLFNCNSVQYSQLYPYKFWKGVY